MSGESTAAALAERLERDAELAAGLERDALGALRGAGFDELAAAAERQRDRMAELVQRIYRDDAFRRAIEEDPSGRLGDFGIPEVALEPLLRAAGAPEDVLERATADVEAHLARGPASAAALATLVGALAFAQQASAAAP
ncbi:MAG TPA: hypothetical protein VNK94_09920, partial [Gaiellaceae bacterium]|nr:hypothetical protein [Gaiellaceae bacterium]